MSSSQYQSSYSLYQFHLGEKGGPGGGGKGGGGKSGLLTNFMFAYIFPF